MLVLDTDHLVEFDRGSDAGDEVTAPGIPANYPAPSDLITGDCIRPASA